VTYGDPLTSDDESLIGSGMIDSTGAMEMVMFIEDKFGIVVPNTEINPDNLDSVNRITALVDRLSVSNVA
ncbi:unnamed protein product, partial [marine sediment metagenome]